MNDIEVITGAERLKKPEAIGFLLLSSFLTSLVISHWGMPAGMMLLIIPMIVVFVAVVP